ncbi:fumarylacetoacetate hydrolase family protein [Flavobacteriaceae bacterium]|nr:fumarylacetoacetate hydrolase family protein [Flavobacteriaceae bacterium]
MKLIRFGAAGKEKAGLEWEGKQYDLSAFTADYDSAFFAEGGLEKLAAWWHDNQANCPLIPPGSRLGAPIADPSKIICVGLNYSKHAKESGMEIPKEPVLFFKATTALCGPNDDVMLPRGGDKTDWEVELAVVIGKKASYVEKEDALDYVAGYTLHNDISERGFQLERSGQWVKGKSCDTFAPLGPFIATKDEIANPHDLNLWLKLNDELLQDSNTSDFVFDIPTVVSYISQFMTLLPGDIISTGTPAGVGLGFDPPRYLKAGDVMELGVDGLGVSKQKTIPFSK